MSKMLILVDFRTKFCYAVQISTKHYGKNMPRVTQEGNKVISSFVNKNEFLDKIIRLPILSVNTLNIWCVLIIALFLYPNFALAEPADMPANLSSKIAGKSIFEYTLAPFWFMAITSTFFALLSLSIYQRARKRRKEFFGQDNVAAANAYFGSCEGDLFRAAYIGFTLLAAFFPSCAIYLISSFNANPEAITRASNAIAWGCVAGTFNITFVLIYFLWQSQRGNLTLRLYAKAALILVVVVVIKGFLDYFGGSYELNKASGFWNATNLIFAFTAAVAPYPLLLTRLFNTANNTTDVSTVHIDKIDAAALLKVAFGMLESERCAHHGINTPEKALSYFDYYALHMIITGADRKSIPTTINSLDVLILKMWVKTEFHTLKNHGITSALQLERMLVHLGYINNNEMNSIIIHELYEKQKRLEHEAEALMIKWGEDLRAPLLSYGANGSSSNIHAFNKPSYNPTSVTPRLIEIMKDISIVKNDILENIKAHSEYPIEQYIFIMSVLSGKRSIRDKVLPEYQQITSKHLERLNNLKELYAIQLTDDYKSVEPLAKVVSYPGSDTINDKDNQQELQIAE